MRTSRPPQARGQRQEAPDVRPPSLILETGVGALFHTALLFSLFLLFAGHNAPGGGFVGGLVAGAAFVLRYVEGGTPSVARAAPVSAHVLIGLGLTVAVTTGAASWLAGEQFLESAKFEAELPLLGTVKTTSALFFDVGVYLVVVGLVIGLLTTLGREDGEGAEPPTGTPR